MFPYLVDLAARLGHWGYVIVAFGAMLESAAFLGLVVPGESLVLVAGFLAGQGVFELDALIVAAALGAIVGDNIGYLLGRRLGRPWAVRHGARMGLTSERLARAEAFFSRHGGKAVIVGRFVGFARALVPFVAGSARMPRSAFLLFNALGAAVWAALVVVLGYFLGEAAHRWAGRASAVVGGTVLAILVGAWLWYWSAGHEGELRASWARLLAWLRRRLAPASYLGLQLSAGVLLFLAAAWLFGEIAEDVVRGEPLTLFDRRVAAWFAAHEDPAVTAFMLGVSRVHTWPYVTGAVLALVAWFAWRREAQWIAFTLLAVPGGMALNTAVKLVVERPRPTLSGLSQALHTYSFPSGHTAAATLLWASLAIYLVMRRRAWRWRVLAVTVAVSLIDLVALSRVYLGVHYVSDVLAAMAEEVAWLALCYTAVNTYQARRARAGLGNI